MPRTRDSHRKRGPRPAGGDRDRGQGERRPGSDRDRAATRGRSADRGRSSDRDRPRSGDRGRSAGRDRPRGADRDRRGGPDRDRRPGSHDRRGPGGAAARPFGRPEGRPARPPDQAEPEDRITRLNPLFEVLRATPNRINKIFIQKGGGSHRVGDVVEQARRHGIPVLFVPPEKIDGLAAHHQGIVAFLSPKEYSTIEEILEHAGPNPFVVLLDEIEDPQNLGAIFRSAEGAGAHGIILPERRSAGLTEAVETVSAGALAHLRVARVTNLARAMEQLKARGLWLVGTEAGADTPWHAYDFTGPVGIVLGSEGKGLRPVILAQCDQLLSIPLLGRVSSLNVAAAAAVFFFEIVRQRGAKAGEGGGGVRSKPR